MKTCQFLLKRIERNSKGCPLVNILQQHGRAVQTQPFQQLSVGKPEEADGNVDEANKADNGC